MNSITKDAFFSVNYHGFFFFSFFLFFFALIFIIKFELTIFLKFSINGNFPCSFRKNYYLRNISLNFFKFFSTWWPKPRPCILADQRLQPLEDILAAWEAPAQEVAWACLVGVVQVVPLPVGTLNLTNVNNA